MQRLYIAVCKAPVFRHVICEAAASYASRAHRGIDGSAAATDGVPFLQPGNALAAAAAAAPGETCVAAVRPTTMVNCCPFTTTGGGAVSPLGGSPNGDPGELVNELVDALHIYISRNILLYPSISLYIHCSISISPVLSVYPLLYPLLSLYPLLYPLLSLYPLLYPLLSLY